MKKTSKLIENLHLVMEISWPFIVGLAILALVVTTTSCSDPMNEQLDVVIYDVQTTSTGCTYLAYLAGGSPNSSSYEITASCGTYKIGDHARIEKGVWYGKRLMR